LGGNFALGGVLDTTFSTFEAALGFYAYFYFSRDLDLSLALIYL
jgi:hypothetical protein